MDEPPKSRLPALVAMAAILASLAGIVGVIATLVKPQLPSAPSVVGSRDSVAAGRDALVAGPNSQVFQVNHGNVFAAPPPSSDPRDVLERGGTKWTRSDFVEALEGGDERAIGLFLAGGMKLTQDELESFVRSNFRVGIAKQLTAGIQPDQPDLCPTAGTLAASFYEAARDNPSKLTFVRTMCAGPQVEAAIKEQLTALEGRLQASRQQNAGRSRAIATCIRDMRQVGENRLLDEASRQAFMTDLAFTPKDTVEAELARALMIGAWKGAWFSDAVREGCSKANPETPINAAEAEQWQGILRLLKG